MIIGGSRVDAHRQRLERWKAEQAGKVWNPKKVKEKGLPAVRHPLAYLIYWYEDIRAANPRGFRVEPISFSEIKAYRDLFDMDMDAFDVDTLRKLDAVWLNCLPKEDDNPGKGK